MINSHREPQQVWKAGSRHRIRAINITPDDIVALSLQAAGDSVKWRPLTKDGAPLPPDDCTERPASQIVGVGETYDFEYEAPAGRRNLWLEVRSPGAKWLAQGRVIIR